MLSNEKLWGGVLNEIELTVSKANFSTWFKNTKIIRQESGVVYVCTPNEFVRDWLTNKYHKMILKNLRGLSENIRSVEYIITKENAAQEENARGGDYIYESSKDNIMGIPLNELFINKEDNLNPKYTFESFIVGPFNNLAHAASQAVIGKPGIVYNPFFVYGETGLGKTHLIQSIGNQIKKNDPTKKIYYATSEKFTLDYVRSLQTNKTGLFKEKYRSYDVLIMDDVQFISNKDKTQEELFHVFNTLYDTNKQIIFSSDRHPNFITGLEDRLKSRFSAGMTIEISLPEYESRVALLRSKLRLLGCEIPMETVEFVASAIQGNIRDLEGVVNTISCHLQVVGDGISIADLKDIIKKSNKPQKNVSPQEIIKTVADFYGIDTPMIHSKTRKKEIVRPRQVIMYILREYYNISFPSIGEKLGGRDHTTVIHSYEKIKKDIKSDAALLQEIERVRALL